jgi:hypothetical protein
MSAFASIPRLQAAKEILGDVFGAGPEDVDEMVPARDRRAERGLLVLKFVLGHIQGTSPTGLCLSVLDPQTVTIVIDGRDGKKFTSHQVESPDGVNFPLPGRVTEVRVYIEVER